MPQLSTIRVLQTSPELDIKGTSCGLKPHSGHPQRVCGNVVPHHNWWSNLPKAPTWRSKETAKKQQRKSALRSARGKFAIHWTRFWITRFLFRGIANLSAAAFDLVGSICHFKCSTIMGPRNTGKTAIPLLLPDGTHFGAIVSQLSSDKTSE